MGGFGAALFYPQNERQVKNKENESSLRWIAIRVIRRGLVCCFYKVKGCDSKKERLGGCGVCTRQNSYGFAVNTCVIKYANTVLNWNV